jgi:predicted phage terminase large subunit-like protein
MTRQELIAQFPNSFPKSFTFVPATLEDNVILNENDPDYRANLQALNKVERERLLHGNWKIKPTKGSYFPATMVNIISAIPTDVTMWVRRWDLAATEPSEVNPSPSATASILMGKRANGRFVIANGIVLRKPANIIRDVIRNTATQDRSFHNRITTVIPQDPGQAGKDQSASIIADLAGYRCKAVRETGPKQTRAEPLSAQWQAGNVDLVEGTWNKEYLLEMSSFPGGDHDDYVDASSGAFLECVAGTKDIDRWRALAE